MSVEKIVTQGLAGIPHAFMGRQGGISQGIYAGLNTGLGSGDEPDAVAANRNAAVAAVRPGAQLCSVYQIHSARAVTVNAPDAGGAQARPRADAMVTTARDVLLGIVTADCAPVLLADSTAGVIGAAHAGWRGALAGVTDNTIALMEKHGASRGSIRAAIGPCIGARSYEVDDRFVQIFAADDEESRNFFKAGRCGHHLFDLGGYLAVRLARAGVGKIELVDEDTVAQPDRFFSYRRSTLAGEAAYGRQISLIALPT
ncbi:peptidoglycan editing factor PgeF [Croceicoccus sp. F390]|uniref:Purine nucleoside phosphorylase n=1 Tax=Croceicoccus esteveae TaxID=3075597 RepID=A0ABU2ZE10_9SPHN|nr:peptidoglycan editing factor PgeF [Croceicoccus sp. F390]MDT0574605.1 peptidoglycan editing factor PgeF [Croceicoccus sp. F390]